MKLGISYKTVSEVRNFTTQDVKLNPKVYITDSGKEGEFIYDSADTSSSDNLGTILLTASGARYKRILSDFIKPEWFGAIGDNSTYDTTAFQDTFTFANASGYNVELSKKTYKISTLTVPDNITILGNGATLNQVRTSGTAVNVIALGNNNTLDNLNIVCDPVNNAYTDNGGIYVFNKVNVTVTNCYVKNHAMYGVIVDRSRNINISNNRFWTNHQMSDLNSIDGLWTNQTDIYIYTNGGGFSENVLIHGNKCNSPFTCQGIWVNGGGYEKNIIVSDNICATTNEDGTIWTATTYWLDNAGVGFIRRHGILLSYQSTAASGILMVSGNICKTTLVTGIYISGGGLGKGVNVVGNICVDNGYTTNTDLSLAGGIAITGTCGAAQIVGNQIIDFRAASVLTGAINIQRNLDSSVAHDVYIADNTIINSAGVGYRIQTSSDNVTINGGLIKNSGYNDIFYNNFASSSNIENWLRIKNLTIIRNNVVSRSIYVDAVDAKKIEIEGVSIKGSDNTTDNGQNSAICIINPKQPIIVKDCIIDKFYDGIFFPTGGLTGRFKNVVISNNYFLNVSYAVYIDSDYPNETFIIGTNNRYESLLQGISHFTNSSGFREVDIFNNDYSFKLPVSNLNVTTGSWVKGDNLYIDSPASGSPYFTLCTTSGTFGTLSSVTGSITTGTKALVVNSATDLRVGMFINIAGVTGTKRITAKSGTNITIDSNANATVVSASVTYQSPTFIKSPNLSTSTFTKINKTIAEVRAFGSQEVTDYPLVYTTDEGKEGEWYYDSTDTTSTDNLGTILVTSSGARYKRVLTGFVKPEWFDAKGDNTTYDTTAFQNTFTVANTLGLNVELSKKTYKISTLTVPDNIIIFGNKATLNQVRTSGTSVSVLVLGNNNVVEDLNIICDPTGTEFDNNGGIHIYDKANVVVKNCYVKNHGIYGVFLSRVENVTISNNRFWSDYKLNAIRYNNDGGLWNNSSDILLYSSGAIANKDVLIENNKCNSPFTSQGIWVSALGTDQNIIINANHCITTNEDGSDWTATTYWFTLGTGFLRRHGIQVAYLSNATSGAIIVSNNICRTTIMTGIYISGGGEGKGVIVSNNYCIENGYTTEDAPSTGFGEFSLAGGIFIGAGSGAITVEGNHVVDFKCASTAAGAFNIQRNTNSVIPHNIKLYNNTIVGSLGVGYKIQNSTDNLAIDGGSIINTAKYDIYYDNNLAGTNIDNWFTVSNLSIVRSNLSFRSMWIDAVYPKKISFTNIVTRGVDAVTNNSENYAIFIDNPTNTTIKISNCVFDTYYIPIVFEEQIQGRRKDIIISNNYFKNVWAAVYADNASFAYTAFIIGIDNKYDTIDRLTHISYNKVFFEGNIAYDETIEINVDDLNITQGSWIKGDKINTTLPTVGGSIGKVCTTSGTFGTLSGVTGSININTKTLTVNSGTNLRAGMFINIVGVSGVKKITNVNGTTITIDTNANATVTNQAVTYQAPVLVDLFKLTTDNYVTLTGNEALTNKTINGVSLTTSGSATNFLNQQGNYVAISGGGDALVANPLSQFAATTSAQLAGVISDETGSGSLVFSNSPTLVTPNLGTPSAINLTNATSIPAGQLTGTISSGVLGNSTVNVGTTAIALNRASGALALTGITSIDGFAAAVTLTADNTTNATNYPLFANAATGNLSPRTDTGFTYNPSTGVLTSTTFAGALSGNATTATTLQTGRTINGTTFDGSTNITITAAAGTLTGTTLNATVTGSSLTSVSTITSGTWSGSFGAVSGANLTNLTAANLTGTIPSAVLGNSSHFIGTTSIALNRASANQALTGILSVQLAGATSGTTTIQPSAIAGTTTITFPAVTGTVITTGDSGTVTNTMLAGSIANAKLANSTISGIALGSNLNALTISTGLSGSSYNGSGAVTIAIDSTVVTLSGSQTLTNKTLTSPTIATIINGAATLTLPTTTDTIVGRATTDTLSNKTLTAPRIADLGFIADANGNELIIFDTVTSAVNEVTFANAATAGTPTFTASGGDPNIGINFVPKGSGTIQVSGLPVVTTTATQTLTNKTLTTPIISSISNTGTLTLPTSTDTLVGRATTDTLTNKRITARVQSTTSTATFTFNFDNDDIGVITAQAAGLTVTTSGTPTSMQPFVLCIKDNGTARAITWNGIFVAIGVTLPTTTVVNKHTYVSGYYNTTAAKVHIVGVTTEA